MRDVLVYSGGLRCAAAGVALSRFAKWAVATEHKPQTMPLVACWRKCSIITMRNFHVVLVLQPTNKREWRRGWPAARLPPSSAGGRLCDEAARVHRATRTYVMSRECKFFLLLPLNEPSM